MELKDQLSSKEYSIKLKKLGVKQKSLWYHIKDTVNKLDRIHCYEEPIYEWSVEGGEYQCDKYPYINDILNNDEWSDWKNDEDISISSAFTVAELGEMLPEWYNSWREDENHESEKWFCWNEVEKNKIEMKTASTEVNARAKMLIYLIENKLIKVEYINK